MVRRANAPPTRVHHTLLTEAWIADVKTLETGIREFGSPSSSENACQVSMFEMTGDPHLHVNVTHAHETKPVKGWAGPGVTAAGFIHNRTFESTSTDRILYEIRRMVFAPRA